MGIISNAVGYLAGEIATVKYDLVKAGVLTPDRTAYEAKASLTDPFGYQSITAFGYKEKYSILDYYKLKQISYSDPIISAIIQTRLNQVSAFTIVQPDKYKAGFKVRMRDLEKEPSDAEKKRCRELEQFVLNCGVPENFEDTPELKRRDSFEKFIRKIARDSLVYDQLNFEVTPRRNGRPYCFTAVDAGTIRLVPDKKEQMESTQSAHTQNYDFFQIQPPQAQHGLRAKEFNPKHPKYVQVINGVVRHTFDEWEMAFGVRNPRTDILSYGYGLSEIEMMVTTVTSHINAEIYNRKVFTQGSVAKGMLAFEGTVPRDQLEAFRRQWHQQVSGVNNAWKTPIMSMGGDTKLNWIDFQKSNKDMEFGKWLEYCIKTICGVYQIDPIEIGFDISKMGASSSNAGGLGEGSPVQRIVQSQDKGLNPLLRFIQGLINDYIIYRIDPNFEFEFVGLNAKSEKDDLEQTEKEVKTYKTINEQRSLHDLEDVKPLDQVDNWGDLILDANIINAWSQANMMKQQQEMGDGEEGQNGDQNGNMNQGDEEDASPVTPEDAEDQPDYEGMSQDQLQKELDKMGKNNPSTQKSFVSTTLKL